jgi:hypothetical protein
MRECVSQDFGIFNFVEFHRAVPKSGQLKTTHGNGRTSGGDIFSTASRLLSSKSHDLPLNPGLLHFLPLCFPCDLSSIDSRVQGLNV